MRNLGGEFFFQKKITIVNGNVEEPNDQPVSETSQQKENMDSIKSSKGSKPFYLDFFPEGGDMIEGITNPVGFKATDLTGKGVDVEGEVVDDNGDVVSSFKSLKFGMGSLFFRPQPGKKYKAVARTNDFEWSFDFPESKANGYVFRIDYLRGSKARILIKTNIPGALSECTLIGHLQGEMVVAMEGIRSVRDEALVALPTEELASGILQLTLFDKNKKPQCERLVFINPTRKNTSVKISSDQSVYQTRDKVELSIDMGELMASSLLLNSSLSVTNYGITQENMQHSENIVNNLLLSSDLKGQIEDPGYYFDENIDELERRRALDNVLITHGWRRFSWEKALTEKSHNTDFDMEQGFAIKGQILTSDRKQLPVASGYTSLNLTSSIGSILDEVRTDENGNFLFAALEIPDSAFVVLTGGMIKSKGGKQNSMKRSNKVQIILKENTPPNLDKQESTMVFEQPLLEQDTSYYDRLDKISAAYDFQETILLEGVTVEDKIYHENDPFQDATKIYGKPSQRLILDSIPAVQSAFDIGQILRGRVAGLRVIGSPPEQQIIMRGISSLSSNSPLFIYNGVPVGSEFIFDMVPSDIAYIDVLKGAKAAAYGFRGGNGVIAIYTRKGSKGYKIDDAVYLRGVLNYTFYGYSSPRKFHSPQYGDAKSEFIKPDYRTTLYWNPTVEFDEEGKAKLMFYTSDIDNSKYRVELEGITNDGVPIRVEKYFQTGLKQ